MPVMECNEGEKPGYKYGNEGACYTYTPGDEESRKRAKQKAYVQGAAIAANTGETVKAGKYDKFIDDGVGLIITPPERKEAAKKSFTEPFPEGEPEVLYGRELVRALHLDIAAEHDAASLYMAHADKVIDPVVKEILMSVAREELVHVGEFEACIDYLTGGAYSEALGEGVAEARGVDEQPVTEGSVTKSVYSEIKKVDDLRHWVTGVVLEPDTVDLQGDVITKEDVRRAMEGYMLKSQAVGRQHEQKAKASVVECYIAPMDFRLGDKELVRKDSWVMTVKVFDEELWQDVVTGKLTGFSIGGKGVRSAA